MPPARLASPSLTTLAMLAVLLGTLTLAGCGQMGPLVLPDASSQGTSASGDEDEGAGAGAREEQDEGGAENER